MNQTHYSDELILALLDGETSRWRTWRMRRHLELCWECRRRSAEIAEGAVQVSRLFSEGAWLPAETHSGSREALLRRLNFVDAEPMQVRRFRGPVWVAAAAVCLAAAFAAPQLLSIRLERQRAAASRPRFTLPAPPKIEAAPGPPPPSAPAPARVAVPEPQPQPNTSAAALLETYWTAHQLGACTQEQLDIRLRDGTVSISGVASTPERRDALAEALRVSVTGVTVEIRSPEDAAPPPTGAVIQLTERKASPSAIPLQEEVAAYLNDSSAEAIGGFARGVVTASERATVQAWALRQLAANFPGRLVARLSPSERLRLRGMIAAHLTALASAQDAVREKLHPFLPAAPVQADAAAPDSWQDSVLAVCESGEAVHRRVYRLFTIGSKDAEPVSAAKAVLAASLGESIPVREQAARRVADLGAPVAAANSEP